MSNLVTLEETRFTESIHLNPEGSVFLGYLYGVLTVAGVLDDGEDLQIGMPNLKVRITVAGAPRIEFPEFLPTPWNEHSNRLWLRYVDDFTSHQPRACR